MIARARNKQQGKKRCDEFQNSRSLIATRQPENANRRVVYLADGPSLNPLSHFVFIFRANILARIAID